METLKNQAKRVESMLMLAGVTEQNEDTVMKMFSQIGIERAVENLNNNYDTNLRIGEYIIKSNQENGFWSNDYGWCYHKDGATGYTKEDLKIYIQEDGSIKPQFFGIEDAEFVLYKKVKDYEIV